MNNLGTSAPAFQLPDIDGRYVGLDDYASASALLVAFICNHCPYVKHIRAGFIDFVREYQPRGVAIVAINSNDASEHPDDAPEMMAIEAKQYGFTFPYLYDETQEIAKAYQAACTPDFFLFDNRGGLVYRGQFDGSRPGNNMPVNGASLRAAVDAVLAGERVPTEQRPSIGCNIKWRSGNEPNY
jgi:peroxiredoxin